MCVLFSMPCMGDAPTPAIAPSSVSQPSVGSSFQDLINQGKWEQAYQLARANLKVNPYHEPSLQALAQIELIHRRYVLAEDYWIQLLAINDENTHYINSLAGTEMKLGEFESAQQRLERSLELDSENALGEFLLLICKVANKETRGVERLARFKTSLQLGQFAAWLVQDQELAQEHPETYRKSAAVILTGRRAIGFNGIKRKFDTFYASPDVLWDPPVVDLDLSNGFPTDTDTITRLLTLTARGCADARDAAAEKKYTDAADALHRSQQHLAWQPCIFQDIALYKFLSGTQKEAIQSLTVTQRLFPYHAYPKFTLGMLHLIDGQPETALDVFTRSTPSTELSFEERLGHAIAFAALGKCEKAREKLLQKGDKKEIAFDQVLEKTPDFLEKTLIQSSLEKCLKKVENNH